MKVNMEMTKDDGEPRATITRIEGLVAPVSGDDCNKLAIPLDAKGSKAWVLRKARVGIIWVSQWGQEGHLVHLHVLWWEGFGGKHRHYLRELQQK